MKKNKIFDEWLLLRIQSGDEKALTILIKKWNGRLMSYINQILNNREITKDIAQESWISIIKGLHRLKKTDKFGAWALSIAHRKAIDYIRNKPKSLAEYELSLETNASIEFEKDTSDPDKLKVAMEHLSPIHKNVLKLFYLEGFTIDEISKITQTTKGTIKSQLFYARNHLKKILKS